MNTHCIVLALDYDYDDGDGRRVSQQTLPRTRPRMAKGKFEDVFFENEIC
jgi:hypothetical protein